MAARDDKSHVRRILETKLDELSLVSSSSQSFIFRVPRALRQVNERAYEPQIISIGPYHHGKPHLKAMEIHKVRYLDKLLRRDQSNDLERYITFFSTSKEEDARNCYAETVTMSSADFVAMMVLDGLFVVELIRKFTDDKLIEENDALFKQNLNLTVVAQDLLLLENQIPFFVLEEFAVMTGLNEELFVNKALGFFSGIEPWPGVLNAERHLVTQDYKHLLGLVHDNWLPSPEELGRYQQRNYWRVFLEEMKREGRLSHEELKRYERWLVAGEWNFIRSATELLEVGIRFKKGRGNSLFDIMFEKGQLHIPTLIVNHDTERIFRNLIAYEQFNQGFSIFMDYARLMDGLINYADDVALLSDCGIIDNWLGSNDDVAKMFNRLNDYVYLSTANFYYFDIFYDVNEYCSQRWNLWKVKLRRKYFQSPWDWILTSIVAATILLLLSLVQTIFSVLAYFK